MHDSSTLLFDIRPIRLDIWHDEPGGHDAGPCSVSFDIGIGAPSVTRCELQAGHAGDHKQGGTRWWEMPTDGDAPSSPPSLPVSAQQPPVGGTGAPEGVQAISGRFEIEAHEYRSTHGLTLGCNTCGAWHAIFDSPIDLAELNQRADEHTEVCR